MTDRVVILMVVHNIISAEAVLEDRFRVGQDFRPKPIVG